MVAKNRMISKWGVPSIRNSRVDDHEGHPNQHNNKFNEKKHPFSLILKGRWYNLLSQHGPNFPMERKCYGQKTEINPKKQNCESTSKVVQKRKIIAWVQLFHQFKQNRLPSPYDRLRYWYDEFLMMGKYIIHISHDGLMYNIFVLRRLQRGTYYQIDWLREPYLCQMKQDQRLCPKKTTTTNMGKRSKTVNYVKPVQHVNKNPQSFQGASHV